MNKTALEIDPSTIARYGAGGALVGGSAASLVNLVHHINMLRAERKRRQQPQDTDENTIVITLPKKAQAQGNVPGCDDVMGIGGGGACTSVKDRQSPSQGDYILNGARQQSRAQGTGKFGPQLTHKRAGQGWPTLTAAWLSALGGGVGGAAVANKLYQAYRERQLKAELEAAKQEYMEALSGGQVKASSFLDDLTGQEKQGEGFGTLNYPLAAVALMTVLGGGATGYITKRILDEKFKEVEDKSLDVPKVKRIVFRSAPETDPEKLASAEDIDCVKAGLMVMMDRVSGTTNFTSQAKQACADAGTTPEALVKLAEDWDVLEGFLKSQPKLQNAVAGIANDYMTKNPVMRYANKLMLKTPMGQAHARKLLFKKLTEMRQGMASGAGKAMAYGRDFMSRVPTLGAGGLPLPTQPLFKAGQADPAVALGTGLGTSMLTASGFGALKSMLADKGMSETDLANAIIAAQEDAKERKAMADTKVKDTVAVEAKDPAAAAYVSKNSKKLQGVIRRLALEGQL